MVVHTRLGGLRIELFIPFDTGETMVEAIELAPLQLDHLLRWQKGKFKSSFDLLSELAGMNMSVLGKLRYPDADRVLTAFFGMLPPEILTNITEGTIPVEQPEAMDEPPAPDAPMGMGMTNEEAARFPQHDEPHPEPQVDEGFDLSEEAPR